MEVVQTLIDQQPHLSSFLLPLFLLLIFFLVQKKIRSPKLNIPPSPPKLLIIGNLHQIGSRAHRSLHALSQKYGDGDLMNLQLGSKPTVVVSSAKAASQVMKTHDQAFSGRPPMKMMKRIFYDLKDSVFSPYDDHWRQMRSILVLHLLTNTRVRSFGQAGERELAVILNKIRDSGRNGVNMSELFLSLTIDLTCGVAFGRKYREEEGCGGIESLSDEVAELTGSGNVEDVLPWMGWINRFNGFNARLDRLATSLDELLERIVREHEAGDRVEEMGDGDEIDGVKDLVDLLLQVHKEGNSNDLSIGRESIKGLLADLERLGKMAWGFGVLAIVYRSLGHASRGLAAGISGCNYLIQMWIWQYFMYFPGNPNPIAGTTDDQRRAHRYHIDRTRVQTTQSAMHYRRILDEYRFFGCHMDLPFFSSGFVGRGIEGLYGSWAYTSLIWPIGWCDSLVVDRADRWMSFPHLKPFGPLHSKGTRKKSTNCHFIGAGSDGIRWTSIYVRTYWRARLLSRSGICTRIILTGFYRSHIRTSTQKDECSLLSSLVLLL